MTANGDCRQEIKRHLLLGRKAMTNLDSILKNILKSRDITLLTKVHIVKPMVFRVVMYGCESWTNSRRRRIDDFEQWSSKESPLDCKEIKPVSPKRNQFRIFTGRTDAEVVAPILWTPDAKSRLIGKDPDAGKD